MSESPRFDRPALLVRDGSAGWRAPESSAFTDEAHLQALLEDEPSLLPGITEAATVREFSVPGIGSVDVVAVDDAGNVTLVECKLAGNPEMRRTVIGQVLAYAAGLWKMDLTDFERSWQARSDGRTLVDSVLGDGHDDQQAIALREVVADALSAGRFSLILAVDAITPELRRVVEYLNAHTVADVTVLAFELAYAREGSVEMLIPRMFGSELAASPTRRPARRRWTESDVIAALAGHGEAVAQVGRRLIDHAVERGAGMYLGDGKAPSITINFPVGQKKWFYPWSIYATDPPVVAANFEYTQHLPRPVRERFVRDVAAIDGSGITVSDVVGRDFMRRPSIRLIGCLDRPGALDQFLAAVDGLLDVPGSEQD